MLIHSSECGRVCVRASAWEKVQTSADNIVIIEHEKSINFGVQYRFVCGFRSVQAKKKTHRGTRCMKFKYNWMCHPRYTRNTRTHTHTEYCQYYCQRWFFSNFHSYHFLWARINDAGAPTNTLERKPLPWNISILFCSRNLQPKSITLHHWPLADTIENTPHEHQLDEIQCTVCYAPSTAHTHTDTHCRVCFLSESYWRRLLCRIPFHLDFVIFRGPFRVGPIRNHHVWVETMDMLNVRAAIAFPVRMIIFADSQFYSISTFAVSRCPYVYPTHARLHMLTPHSRQTLVMRSHSITHKAHTIFKYTGNTKHEKKMSPEKDPLSFVCYWISIRDWCITHNTYI